MKSENESREESYQETVKLLEASLKPDPSFRSLGDLLSDGAFMIPLAPRAGSLPRSSPGDPCPGYPFVPELKLVAACSP
jgi:hypothetical protein